MATFFQEEKEYDGGQTRKTEVSADYSIFNKCDMSVVEFERIKDSCPILELKSTPKPVEENDKKCYYYKIAPYSLFQVSRWVSCT